ncbi:M20 family metallopeptidase [Nocardioides sp.]|uniref:M20 metallopeptidase family protein n=1 Tax=Nocardioides sp. TaxID=35761 RepID=UPI002BB5F136|nr:M20 family metallopeptidase [Nocardioides sp.]HXH77368.1 M20 family metallopeptidase [Nocardioides sp.]
MRLDWTPDRLAGLFSGLAEQLPDAIALRRALHSAPRVGGDESETTRMLLDTLGMEHELLSEGGALVRVGSAVGPAIGLRAELDALPIVERTDVSWRSRGEAMHACGHDVHMAAAVAVARTLQTAGAPVPLLLLLQPREEVLPSGALDLRESPAFKAHDVRAVVGVHLQPRLAQGHFAATGGAVNAAADQFTIVVHGQPGHAAYPHLTADPVVAAADLIGTLQHLVSRRVDPTNPTVLTIGTIEGGKSHNVVPAAVRMSGILRTFHEEERTQLHRAIKDTAHAIAGVYGCTAEVQLSLGAPVLDNDPTLATTAAARIEHAGLVPAAPHRSCGADDFSYYCSVCPSLMVFVGVGTGGVDQPGLHHPRFLPPDDSVGEVATAMLAAYLGACETVAGVDLPGTEVFSRHVRR